MPTYNNYDDSSLFSITEEIARIFSPLASNFVRRGNEAKTKDPELFMRFATLVFKYGEDPLLDAGIHLGTRLPEFKIVQSEEVKNIANTRNVIVEYLDDDHKKKPFNICLLAPPGGGKSTIVDKLCKSITEHSNPAKKRLKLMTFNASQYETVDHFREVWNTVRLESNKHPVLCFIDEFDVAHCKWIGHFLAPANDGATFEPYQKNFGNKVVFIFGGGVFESRLKLEANIDRYDKLADFMRRMDGYIDLLPAAFCWEHPQENHASLYMPTHHEELDKARIRVNYWSGKLEVLQRNIDLFWDDDTRQLIPRKDTYRRRNKFRSQPVNKKKEASEFFEVEAGIWETENLTSDHAVQHLNKEVLFAMLKRALAFRFQIEHKNSKDNSDRSHMFDMYPKWEKDKLKAYKDSWTNSWIDKPVAWLLLHPAMRLQAGLGSIEKFVVKMRFMQADKLTKGMLPPYDISKHLVEYGPRDLQHKKKGRNSPYDDALERSRPMPVTEQLMEKALDARKAAIIWPKPEW